MGLLDCRRKSVDVPTLEFVAAREYRPTIRQIVRMRQSACLSARPDKQHHSLSELIEWWRERARPSLGQDTVARVESLAAAAYYVVSEALTNVARYAPAACAAVRVMSADGQLRVEVSDDGIGGAEIVKGSGLQGLRDRVEAIDGRLEIRSRPGAGTHVIAHLPLHPRHTVDSEAADATGC